MPPAAKVRFEPIANAHTLHSEIKKLDLLA
jgi:hypothetical protein